MKQPLSQERKYRKALRALVASYQALVETQIIDELPMFVAEREGQVRVDSWVDDIQRAVTTIRLAITGATDNAERESVVVAGEIADFNSAQWRQIVRNAVGVDIVRGEPWLADEIRSFAAENAALIKSIPEQSLTRVEGIVQRGVRNGVTATSMSKQIQAEFGVAKSRADLIARDQSAKLNGSVTERRQRQIGLKTYYWDTAGDERVRREHRKLDGKLCKWDDDTVYSDDGGLTWKARRSIGAYIGKPSKDYNCRCNARSDTDALLAELGV